jgi:hypothetical protein
MKRCAFSLVLISIAAFVGCGSPQTASVSQTFSDSELTFHTERVETPAAVLQDLSAFEDRTMAQNDDGTLVAIERIVNLGKQAWQFIEKNRPVTNIAYDYANALPKGVQSASDLAGFSDVQYESWRYYGKNGFGMTVFDVTYTLVHQYGGSYEGQGSYLTSVAVVPSNVDVMWGYTVNFKVTNVATTNVGTSLAPVASLNLEMAFDVSTIIKNSRKTKLFQFRGDRAKPFKI